MTSRIFIGVPVSETFQKRLTGWCDGHRALEEGGTFISPSNFHVTFHFLGELEEWKKLQFIAALKKIKQPSFKFTFTRVLGFPSNERARVIAIAGPGGNSPFSSLYEETTKILDRLGVRPETRVFIPHITVFRASKELQLSQVSMIEEDLTLEVEKVQLYESKRGLSGSEYSVVGAVDLSN